MNINTKVWQINIDRQNWQVNVMDAAKALAEGHRIAFPTETVYGLGADARNSEAVQGVFQAKGRPSDNPLIVHIADQEQLKDIVETVSPLAEKLMDEFWPGPLTIIFPVKPNVLSEYVTAGLDTVGVRMPDHPIALELIKQSNCPVAAPSANRSGRPSPTLAKHVVEDLNGYIEGVVDGGATGVGLESTVVELIENQAVRILRPGGVTKEMLQEVLVDIEVWNETMEESITAPRSPGMKYTHYAPNGSLTLVKGPQQSVESFIQEQMKEKSAQGSRTGVLAFQEHLHAYQQADVVQSLGSMTDLQEAAAVLYDALRHFDEEHVQYIWCEASTEQGIGQALMNRLMKAAGHQMMYV